MQRSTIEVIGGLEITTVKDGLKALLVVQLRGEQKEVWEQSSAMSQAAQRKNEKLVFHFHCR